MALPRKLAAGWVRAVRITPEVSRSSRCTSRGREPPGFAKAQVSSSSVLALIRPPWLDRPAGLFRAMMWASCAITMPWMKAISSGVRVIGLSWALIFFGGRGLTVFLLPEGDGGLRSRSDEGSR
jgi:hypothetical protein